jgi:hypothetical protein
LGGVGAFFGAIIGTPVGDAIAGDPACPKAVHDVESPGSDTHFQNRPSGAGAGAMFGGSGDAYAVDTMADLVVENAGQGSDAVWNALITPMRCLPPDTIGIARHGCIQRSLA